MRALFICSRNRLRSPTAESIFAHWPNVDTDSAGLAPDADVPLTADQLEWAEVIFVMERSHRRRLSQRFGAWLRGKRVVCLDTPDDYAFMQPELVALLERRAGPYLRS
ncbi:low molecular weight protein tyrosine phosphatase family protein [Ralstonia pseudosolanacearum]